MKKFFKVTLLYLKKNLTILIIFFIFLFLYICDNASIKAGNVIIQNLKSIATSFTPTTDLFDDGSEISFVSYFFGMQSSKKQTEDLLFSLPSNTTQDYDENGYCLFVSGVVYPICSGRVVEVGYSDNGEKYIKVEHVNNYFSRYQGLTNVGVAMGDIVNINYPIGISESTASISIENKNDLLKLSDVKWKN